MRLSTLIRILLVVLVSALALGGNRTGVRAQQQQLPQQQQTSILFTAFDRNKSPVATLRKEDIRVLEDGVPQEIMAFEHQTEQPLSLAILIDASISQERALPAEKQVALAFVDSVIRSSKDTAAIISFTHEAILKQNSTSDLAQLRQAIDSLKFEPPPGYVSISKIPVGKIDPSSIPKFPGTIQGSTAIWDAIWATCQMVIDRTPANTRRAIILLSDGVNTTGRKKKSEAIDRALQSETLIYSIGINDPKFLDLDRSALEEVSKRTGGYFFFPKKNEHLPVVFKAIEQALRSPYLVSYSSKDRRADKRFHKIRIEIVNPELRKQNLQISHQQGYFTK